MLVRQCHFTCHELKLVTDGPTSLVWFLCTAPLLVNLVICMSLASNRNNCNQCSRMNNTQVVGFDIEWKVTFTSEVRKTALIQLCPSTDICYLFHICMMIGKVPCLIFLLPDTVRNGRRVP